MSTQNIPRPTAEYHCSQPELYATSNVIAGSYTQHKERFKAKSTKYTDTTGTDLKAMIRDAQLLPDEARRNAEHAGLRIELGPLAVTCLDKWQMLEGYIRDGYAPSLHEVEWAKAGKTHYAEAAADDWEQVSLLMSDGAEYIGDNTAALTTGGMIVDFDLEFAAAATAFNNKLDAYKQAEESAREDTDVKLNANNAIYAEVMRICEDGKKFFKDNGAIREEFTFDTVLELVRGNLRTHKVSGNVKRATDNTVVVNGKMVLQKQLPDGSYGPGIERKTDLAGNYLYTEVRNGQYLLSAGGDGLETQTKTITVEDGPVVVDFVLGEA